MPRHKKFNCLAMSFSHFRQQLAGHLTLLIQQSAGRPVLYFIFTGKKQKRYERRIYFVIYLMII